MSVGDVVRMCTTLRIHECDAVHLACLYWRKLQMGDVPIRVVAFVCVSLAVKFLYDDFVCLPLELTLTEYRCYEARALDQLEWRLALRTRYDIVRERLHGELTDEVRAMLRDSQESIDDEDAAARHVLERCPVKRSKST